MKTITHRTKSLLIAAVALSSSAVSAWGTQVITHTFAPGNFDGWTQIIISGAVDPTLQFRATEFTIGNRLIWEDPGAPDTPGGIVVSDGTNANNLATPHNSVILRSPTFTLNGENALSALSPYTVTEISFDLIGGKGIATGPNNVSDIPEDTVENDGDMAFMGVGLRRVSDNDYLTWSKRSANGQASSWQSFTLDETALATAIGADPTGTLYTLDFVDAGHGAWGFVGMDHASFTVVPEPASVAAFLGFAALGLVFARRRRSAS